jgi:hypothetical protein
MSHADNEWGGNVKGRQEQDREGMREREKEGGGRGQVQGKGVVHLLRASLLACLWWPASGPKTCSTSHDSFCMRISYMLVVEV